MRLTLVANTILLAGSETNYGNMGQAYGAMSQTQDYTTYLNSMSGLNYEKSALRSDIDWVMKKAIPRMLARVFRSEQFNRELVKVHKVFIEGGRELGRQEAHDLLMANQRISGCDPNLPRKVKDVVKALNKVKWECMEIIVSSSDLSPNLLCSVLERVIVARVKGRAVDLQHKVFRLYNKVCLAKLAGVGVGVDAVVVAGEMQESDQKQGKKDLKGRDQNNRVKILILSAYVNKCYRLKRLLRNFASLLESDVEVLDDKIKVAFCDHDLLMSACKSCLADDGLLMSLARISGYSEQMMSC
ncbi:hypothetical protein Tco_0768794 [Tanacetum coccineum]